jgi:hypothetical protein
MPAKRQPGRSLHLLQAFLHFVLAEIDLADGCGRPNVIGIEGFGNSDQADGRGIASYPAGGARDAVANVCQPGSKRGGIEHYFFGS